MEIEDWSPLSLWSCGSRILSRPFLPVGLSNLLSGRFESVQTDYYSYEFVLRKLEARVWGRRGYEGFLITEPFLTVARQKTNYKKPNFVCRSIVWHHSSSNGALSQCRQMTPIFCPATVRNGSVIWNPSYPCLPHPLASRLRRPLSWEGHIQSSPPSQDMSLLLVGMT